MILSPWDPLHARKYTNKARATQTPDNMAPRKKKTTHESESDSNSSIGVNEQLEQPGDTAYVAPRARAPRTSSSARPYGLRNHSQVQRPVRSRGAALTSTNRLSVHPQPAFNHELARFIPWKTLLPGHKGPIPSEMAYAEYVAEREHKQKNRDNEPSNQEIEVVFRPTHKNGEPSSGPTVAHLSHKSPKQDPLRNLYTADANPGIADNTKFHPPSDQYSYRNEYDPMFSLDAFDEETVEGQHKLERRKTAYVVGSSTVRSSVALLHIDMALCFSLQPNPNLRNVSDSG